MPINLDSFALYFDSFASYFDSSRFCVLSSVAVKEVEFLENKNYEICVLISLQLIVFVMAQKKLYTLA